MRAFLWPYRWFRPYLTPRERFWAHLGSPLGSTVIAFVVVWVLLGVRDAVWSTVAMALVCAPLTAWWTNRVLRRGVERRRREGL